LVRTTQTSGWFPHSREREVEVDGHVHEEEDVDDHADGEYNPPLVAVPVEADEDGHHDDDVEEQEHDGHVPDDAGRALVEEDVGLAEEQPQQAVPLAQRLPVLELQDGPPERARVAAVRRGLGSTRVIRRRFNVSVPRARVPDKASALRDRSER